MRAAEGPVAARRRSSAVALGAPGLIDGTGDVTTMSMLGVTFAKMGAGVEPQDAGGATSNRGSDHVARWAWTQVRSASAAAMS